MFLRHQPGTTSLPLSVPRARSNDAATSQKYARSLPLFWTIEADHSWLMSHFEMRSHISSSSNKSLPAVSKGECDEWPSWYHPRDLRAAKDFMPRSDPCGLRLNTPNTFLASSLCLKILLVHSPR